MDKFDITAPEILLDKTVLKTTIDAIPEDTSAFGEGEAVQALNAQLTSAEAVFENPNSQEEINQAAKALNPGMA